MSLYARSARNNTLAQTYHDHVDGVMNEASFHVEEMLPFLKTSEYYKDMVVLAAEFHDLGKLDEKNQVILSGKEKAEYLPIDHKLAGAVHVHDTSEVPQAAFLIQAHHKPGLMNFIREAKKFEGKSEVECRQHIDAYLKLHNKEMGKLEESEDCKKHKPKKAVKVSALGYRILLSCLVDADYKDASQTSHKLPDTKWKSRLKQLDAYVSTLNNNADKSIRNQYRNQVYHSCRNHKIHEVDQETQTKYIKNIVYCDSPVGTGKTTAVMAHMLKRAITYKLRHIIIIVPYTNIISQTVKVLRDALVLDGEQAEDIVAEHHHQVEFENEEFEYLATTWNAPIIVTTAVQFFETLASNQPSKLRKLHQLPGSAIIIDESQVSMPSQYLYLVWRWMKGLSLQWGCHICLYSGTMVKFWEENMSEHSTQEHKKIESLIPETLSKKLWEVEKNRVPMTIWNQKFREYNTADDLLCELQRYEGSRVVILDTVESVAVFTKLLKEHNVDVLSLSSAVSPEDKELIISKVEKRLRCEPFRNWVLVATSCIECGMNFSFQYGFCEVRSLLSYLQLLGRINRDGEFDLSGLFTFIIKDERFTSNPSLSISKQVFHELSKNISNDEKTSDISMQESVQLCFKKEKKLVQDNSMKLWELEADNQFEDVAKQFKLIDSDMVTVIVNSELNRKIKARIYVCDAELQRGSVRIRKSLLERLKIKDMAIPYLSEDQYDCTYGYMKSLI